MMEYPKALRPAGMGLLLLCTVPVGAAVVALPDCDQNTVQSGIDAAQDGDTLALPECEEVWESSAGNNSPDLTFNDSPTPAVFIWKKAVTLLGAESGDTRIVDGTGGNYGETAVYVHGELGKPFRISRINFTAGESPTIVVRGSAHDWRIDHCNFSSPEHIRAIEVLDLSYGLVDNNVFTNTRLVVWGGYGHESWKQPLNLGSRNAVYVEDNRFVVEVFGNVIDCNGGGRYVFRHNEVINGYCEAHSLQNGFSDGTFQRGARSYEIYNNHFKTIDNGASPMWVAISLRAGTGVVFSNVVENISGPKYYHLGTLDNRRSFQTMSNILRKCDGTHPLDGNEGATGYPCLDQIGRSTDDGAGDNRHPQALEPLYIWDNVLKENDGSVSGTKLIVHNGEEVEAHIQEGRDFIHGTPKPGYTPYRYPHPLRSQKISAFDSDVHGSPVSYFANSVVFSALSGYESLTVYDLRGNRIRSLPVLAPTVRWDGLDASGRALQKGVYIVKFQGTTGVKALPFMIY